MSVKKPGVAKLVAQQIMTADVVAVTPMMSIRQIIEILLEHEISGAPVVDQAYTVITVVTEADLMKFAALSSLEEPLNSFLNKLTRTDRLISVSKNDSFRDVFKQFLVNPVRRVVVVDASGKLQGIIARRNIIRAFLESTPAP